MIHFGGTLDEFDVSIDTTNEITVVPEPAGAILAGTAIVGTVVVVAGKRWRRRNVDQ